MIETIPGKLASEIARVTELREHYRSLDGMPQVNVKPALLMMDAALAQAIAAAGSPDVEQQIAAVQALGEFTG